jgi:hypothetical protein
MKRDFDLIRKILIEVQNLAPNQRLESIEVEGYDDEIVNAHASLLIDAGLMEGSKIAFSGQYIVSARALTWAGHDFIEAAMKDTLWEKAKTKIKESGSAMTIDVLKEVLKSLALSAVT